MFRYVSERFLRNFCPRVAKADKLSPRSSVSQELEQRRTQQLLGAMHRSLREERRRGQMERHQL